jgi:hypothetical protein
MGYPVFAEEALICQLQWDNYSAVLEEMLAYTACPKAYRYQPYY